MNGMKKVIILLAKLFLLVIVSVLMGVVLIKLGDFLFNILYIPSAIIGGILILTTLIYGFYISKLLGKSSAGKKAILF